MARLMLAAALASTLASSAMAFSAVPCSGAPSCLALARAGSTSSMRLLPTTGPHIGAWGLGRTEGGPAPARRGAAKGLVGPGAAVTMLSEQRLITKPRTSHAWFGVYFDVEARDVPITIQTIETGCSSGADGQTLRVQLWATKDGSFVGKEEDESAWECMGEEDMVLSTVNYDRGAYDASEAKYAALPLKETILVEPGSRRGFMIHTSSLGGLILRGGFGPEGQKNNWKVGEKSDETVHMLLCAGPVTASSPFTLEKDSPGWARAFAGSISYTI